MNDLLLRAARGEQTERTPIWLMRQAGRTDPEYNRLRETAEMPLEALFSTPELAARISLLPRRIGVDAIIIFQDILTPLTPMGAPFVFRPGPMLERPLRSPQDLDALRPFEMESGLAHVRETFRLIHEMLGGTLPVLGFAGAPFTLLVFLVEGKSFGERADAAFALLREAPALANALLDKLTAMTIDYLRFQAVSGAQVVQLFESAAFLCKPGAHGETGAAIYREFALPYQRRIFSALRGIVPTIHFAREWTVLEDLDAAGADIISLPASISIREARNRLGEHRVFQGNLDNELLARGAWPEIEAAARACVKSGEHRGHIFNLSHGLLRETPFAHVERLVRLVHEIQGQTTNFPAGPPGKRTS